MELSGVQRLPVGPQQAWAALDGIEPLQACMPAGESLRRTAQDAFEATVHAAMGPVTARLRGTFALTDANAPPSHAAAL
ncbi:MAG TPA: SRPBCC domain-containing protein [Burkholderiaceae bacterium]|nr:SRPBCC domain-containing protein [Burkholderiaceae bacterium]